MLYTKAWVTHIFLMLWRVIFALLGISYWQKSYGNYEDNPKLEPEKVAQTETFVKVSLSVLTVIGLILDIACWRKANLARYIMVYESIYLPFYCLCPFGYGDFQAPILLFIVVFNYIMLSSHVHVDAIMSGLCYAVCAFGSQNFLMTAEAKKDIMIQQIVLSLLSTILSITAAMIITYISI